MAVGIGRIINWMEEWAPPALAEDWDNPGLQLGDRNAEAAVVLTALEMTPAVAKRAADLGAALVVTHHPLLFHGVKHITADDALGRLLFFLIAHHIAVYSAHTNLDRAAGGSNDLLCRLCGLGAVEQLGPVMEGLSMGRLGRTAAPVTLEELAGTVKKALGLSRVTYVGDPGTAVHRVAVCSGAGADLMEAAAAAGADVLLTGDVKHHEARRAQELGLCLIDGTHYGTEAPLAVELARYLQEKAGAALTVAAFAEDDAPLRDL